MNKSLEYRINKILEDVAEKTRDIHVYDIQRWDWDGKPMSVAFLDVKDKVVGNRRYWETKYQGMIEIEKMIEEVPLVEALTSPSEYVRKYREFRENSKL